MKKPEAKAEHRATSAVLEAARTRAKMTRLALAIKAKVDPSTVFQAERGTASLETKIRLGKALGLSAEKLFKKTA